MKKIIYLRKELLFILSLFIFIFINFFFINVNLKLDFSRGQAYSISNSTKKILKSIKEPITLTLYISSSLPTSLVPLKKDLLDLVSEYKKQANGKLNLVIKDPDQNEKIKKEMESFRITKLQISEVEDDQFSVKSGYLGGILEFQGNKIILPALISPSNLEYELSSTLFKLIQDKLPLVGIIVSSDKGYSLVNKFLGKQFDLKIVTIENLDSFVLDSLIYVDDQETELKKTELRKLEEFINNNKSLFIFANGYWINSSFEIIPAKHNLNELTEKYGIQIQTNLIESLYSETTNYQSGNSNLIVRYPFWLKLTNKELSQSINFQNSGTTLLLPWVSSLKLFSKKNIETNSLIVSPQKSWIASEPINIMPDSVLDNQPKTFINNLTLGAISKTNKGRLVVFGSNAFLNDNFNNENPVNLDFLSRLLDNDLSNGTLSGISSRQVSFVPLKEISSNEKQTIRITVTLFPVLISAIYGVIRLKKRRVL